MFLLFSFTGRMQVCVWMYIEMYWSLGGVRGPKAGNALQEVCVCVCMKWGTVGARRWNYIFLFFFVWVPGLCLDGNRPGCAWTPLTPPKLLSPEGWPHRYLSTYICIRDVLPKNWLRYSLARQPTSSVAILPRVSSTAW